MTGTRNTIRSDARDDAKAEADRALLQDVRRRLVEQARLERETPAPSMADRLRALIKR